MLGILHRNFDYSSPKNMYGLFHFSILYLVILLLYPPTFYHIVLKAWLYHQCQGHIQINDHMVSRHWAEWQFQLYITWLGQAFGDLLQIREDLKLLISYPNTDHHQDYLHMEPFD